MKRTTFTRYRTGGAPAATLSPAWVSIYAPAGGAPTVIVRGQVQSGVTAAIDVVRVADVLVNDFLKDGQDGRIFQVLQLEKQGGRLHLLAAEVKPPIPDEFESGAVEGYWTGSGWTIDAPSGVILSPHPSATLPSLATLLYQDVDFDFDMWGRCRADGGAAGAVRRVLLAARHPSTGLGVYAGIKDDGANSTFIRLDEYSAGLLAETTGAAFATATLGSVRLSRVGAMMHAYHSGETLPNEDADWTEITPGANIYTTTAQALRVGLAGYTQTGAVGDGRWQFIRNWLPL